MAENEFRLPGSSYEELANIIVAYGTRDEAANPGDVSKLDYVHQSSSSRNNAFLASIGVLKGEKERLVTRKGRELALSLSRRNRREIQRAWHGIVATDEFLQNVVSAVKLREGMARPSLQAYIAHAARQPRNKPVMTGADAIIDILKAAGLLKEDAGELSATFEDAAELRESAVSAGEGAPAGTAEAHISASVAPEEGPQVNIHLHVHCSPEEIEDLAPRLKALLREMSGP